MFDASFDDLIQSAYDAAGSQAGWEAFVARYAHAMGADLALMGHQCPQNTYASVEVSHGFEPGRLEQFSSYYHRINPYASSVASTRAGDCVEMSDRVPDAVVAETEFHVDFVAPQKVQMGGTLVKMSASPMSLFALHARSDRPAHALGRTVPLQRRIVRHLQGALALHLRLADLETENRDLQLAVELTSTALVLCDARGGVRRVNPCAERLLQQNDGLTVRNGQLGALHDGAARRVALALRQVGELAERRCRDEPCLLFVPRTSSRPDYQLLVVPVPERHEALRESAQRVLVFLHDPDSEATTNEAVLCAEYGLTPRESRVTLLLCSGASTADVSGRLGVTRETLKSHFKSVFAKVGVHTQGQLVARVLASLARLRLPR